MKVEAIKDTIIKKGIKAIPKAIWVICASYALIVLTTVFALMIAHIDADKRINRYFDILLTDKENKQSCDTAINDWIAQIKSNSAKIELNTEQVKHNTELAHEGKK